MDSTKNINEIISCAVIGDFLGQKSISIRSFGFGKRAINFINEGKEKYTTLVLALYEEDTEIFSTYTLKKYESCFINCFSENIRSKKKISNEEYHWFKLKMKSREVSKYSVIRGIYGVTLLNVEKPVKFGLYTIYSFQHHKRILEKKSFSSPEHIWFGDEPEYFIEWVCNARHSEKALEIADNKFEKFEIIIKYIIGHTSERIEVAVFNYQGWRNRQAFVFSEKNTFHSGSSHGSFEPVAIDNDYFSSQSQGYNKVWDMVSSENLNKFQKRILLAVEWLGQSIGDSSPQSSFLKAAISLEILFTYNEKIIITPSILNQLSESVALIVGVNVEGKLELESRVKKLYSLRSAIVHSGKLNIQEAHRNELLQIARTVIRVLLTEGSYDNINSIEELYLLLKKIKYSGGMEPNT